MELAKRIYRMPEEQCEELQQIIIDNQTDDMQMISDPGNIHIYIYVYYYSASFFLTCV